MSGLGAGKLMLIGLLTLVMIGAVGLVVYMIRKNSRANTVAPWKDVADALTYDVICPRCNAPMSPGFSVAARGLSWRAEGAFQGAVDLAVYAIPNTLNAGLSPGENRAWICRACRVVTLDYRYLVTGAPPV